MAYSKGLNSGGSHRGKPYVLILLITFGAALLGVMVLHKLRERRIYSLLVKEKEQQILALQLLLQKERDRSKELREKNEDMKAKLYSVRNQKMELARTVAEMQSTMDSMKDEQKVMESAFEEQQNALRIMERKGTDVEEVTSEMVALRENLKHKEEEIKDLKQRLENEISVKNNHLSINDHLEIVAANGTVSEQEKTENENKEKDESSRESASDDASNRKSTNVKDGTVTAEIKDEIQTETEPEKANGETLDYSGAAKNIETEVVDDREKKAIKEQPEKLESNANGGGQDFNAKQSAGRRGNTAMQRGKRWRTIVKNRVMKNNGISESHGEVNMGNRKVYRYEKDELKSRIVGEVSNEEGVAREGQRRDKDNPIKDKAGSKLLKPDNHDESREANNMTVNDKNQQVTENEINIYHEKQEVDEIRQSEEHKESNLKQTWSRRHDNNAGKTKSNMFHDEAEQLEVMDMQNKGKDTVDGGNEEDNDEDTIGFSRDSQFEFEDEKEEYKEEIDESEFRPGL